MSIERRPVNELLPPGATAEVRQEGAILVVPVVEEVLVIEKRLMLREEILVSRRQEEVRSPQRVTLRRESATVERIDVEVNNPSEGT